MREISGRSAPGLIYKASSYEKEICAGWPANAHRTWGGLRLGLRWFWVWADVVGQAGREVRRGNIAAKELQRVFSLTLKLNQSTPTLKQDRHTALQVDPFCGSANTRKLKQIWRLCCTPLICQHDALSSWHCRKVLGHCHPMSFREPWKYLKISSANFILPALPQNSH